MQVIQKQTNDVTLLFISGEVTINNTEELTKIIKKIVAGKSRKVLLNLRKLDYIDSSGLACFIRFSRDLQKIEGALFFADLPPKIRSIFAITKLESAFTIYESEEEALRGFSGY